MWEAKAGVQAFKKEFHTYIHLDYARVEILSCKKKKKIVQVAYNNLLAVVEEDHSLCWPLLGAKESMSLLFG